MKSTRILLTLGLIKRAILMSGRIMSNLNQRMCAILVRWTMMGVMLAGPSPLFAQQDESGGIESRGMPQHQLSMKPGGPVKQDVSGQPNARIPKFPQKFDVQGPETTSFGFAVTQPGPITIDVQAQGAPLLVSLQSQGGQPITQQATGTLRMSYNVTPQDLQRSLLWLAQIRLAQPMPPERGGRAAGTINIQSPPVDQAAAQRAAQAQRRTPTQQELDQARAQGEAQVAQAIAARKAQFAQEQEHRYQMDRARVQSLLERMRSGMTGQVRPRGLEKDGSEATKPAQATDEITSRAVPNKSFQTMKQQSIPLSAQEMNKMIIPPPLPSGPPRITSLSETSGGPGKWVVITGTGFSDMQDQVYFTVPPDRAVPATILYWTDTAIKVELPDVTDVMPYQASLYVQRGQDLSNKIPFNFIPRQELRTIRDLTTDRAHSGTVLTTNIDGPRSQIMHVRIPGIPFSEFTGEKGNDEFFLRTQLKNGWTVAGARLLQIPVNVTVSAAQAGSYQWLGDGYIQAQGTGSNPYLNVRWWVNAFTPFTTYNFLIDIVGPKGVPDGIVCTQAPCP